MARINTNVASLMAQKDLSGAYASLNQSLQRLSSGLRINRGADDPAGLIASESLRNEIAGISQAINNSQRASNVVATAEGALNEVAALLLDIKQLTVHAANTGAVSPEEIQADQLQIDSAVQSITRIANVTNFAGLNLLDGSLDYILSGVDTTEIAEVHIFNAQFGTASMIPVNVEIQTSALPGQLLWRNSAVASSVSIEVAGRQGVEVFTFISGTGTTAILFAINQAAEATGVSATLISATDPTSGLTFTSNSYGSAAFVSVKAMPNSGTFDTETVAAVTSNRAIGQDVAASINGTYTVGKGLTVSLNTTYLSLDLTLDESLAWGTGTTNFNIKGGGALFQLGPHVSINEQRSFGVQSIAASSLGNKTLGFLSEVLTGGSYSLVAGQASQAAQIVDEAISQVAGLRGRMGAFEKNTLATNIASLEVALENVTASESAIRDADFAAETAALTRGQILTSAATSVLAMANSLPQTVLQLLQ